MRVKETRGTRARMQKRSVLAYRTRWKCALSLYMDGSTNKITSVQYVVWVCIAVSGRSVKGTILYISPAEANKRRGLIKPALPFPSTYTPPPGIESSRRVCSCVACVELSASL
ncbi:hypothetical protein DAEQUDRAFT_427638 [Daedalea quercina L-15889]|uniref:Uncharacterized protein n=1 Tax=Daedalea quercina L-15889 TaxID=1314783 RepID=A0A165NIW0_9APHY|nr:hypothetical protein DAEQUDRAFT_427638 [Daedalea quercina L-15889]